MANDFISAKEVVSRITASIKQSEKEYQEETGCNDDERSRLEIAILYGALGGLICGESK